MSAQRGEPFDFGVGHINDRVFYEGKEYRVTYWHRLSGQVYLVGEADPDESLQVHVHHLTVSWCPKVHGGQGRPAA